MTDLTCSQAFKASQPDGRHVLNQPLIAFDLDRDVSAVLKQHDCAMETWLALCYLKSANKGKQT